MHLILRCRRQWQRNNRIVRCGRTLQLGRYRFHLYESSFAPQNGKLVVFICRRLPPGRSAISCRRHAHTPTELFQTCVSFFLQVKHNVLHKLGVRNDFWDFQTQSSPGLLQHGIHAPISKTTHTLNRAAPAPMVLSSSKGIWSR